MADLFTTQTWRLQVLTPLHIGSGDILHSGFDFTTEKNETCVLDVDRIWEAALFENPDAPLNLALLKSQPADLAQGALGADSPLVRYRMAGTPQGEEIRAQIKDARLCPYIPGSTIKGAIRTLFLWEMVRRGMVKVTESILGDRGEYAAEAVEQAAFGPDHNHSWMRVLKISDSTPAPREQLQLLRACAFGSNHQREAAAIPINVEAIEDGTQLSASVTIERYLLEEPSLKFGVYAELLAQLPAIARNWAEGRLKAEAEFYERRKWTGALMIVQELRSKLAKMPASYFMMQLGWGTGWSAKTVTPLLPKNAQDQIIQRYGLSRGKHLPGAVFPKSRRMSGARRAGELVPEMPLGWVMVSVKTNKTNQPEG